MGLVLVVAAAYGSRVFLWLSLISHGLNADSGRYTDALFSHTPP